MRARAFTIYLLDRAGLSFFAWVRSLTDFDSTRTLVLVPLNLHRSLSISIAFDFGNLIYPSTRLFYAIVRPPVLGDSARSPDLGYPLVLQGKLGNTNPKFGRSGLH